MSRIISFAWTTQVFKDRKKTVTRRFWKDSYAELFKAGDYMIAYDKVPFAGGKEIGVIKLTCKPYKEKLSLMTDDEEKKEGGLWGSAKAFIKSMGGPDKVPWVIRFEIIAIGPL